MQNALTARDRLQERLADAEHESWSRWVWWLFNTCKTMSDGSVVIPVELAERWKRQSVTAYAYLSEAEKEVDRKEGRLSMPIIADALREWFD